ncbi:Transcription termination factor (N utilization substance protein B) [Bacteroidales bacterium Barb6XT]|nr:Transcription termination factor (N utilization substance protein B) [Bacteroidales bacterium Barb6XT]
MVNRILIRIKVLQIVYAFYQNENSDMQKAEKELLFSLQKAYDLYLYLLILPLAVTNLYERITDKRKRRYMPSQEDMNPDTRLVNNRFTALLSQNEALSQKVAENSLSWENDTDFIKTILDILLASDLYAEYLQNPDDSFETDREFWRAFFKQYICGNEIVETCFEDKSLYWNDDIDIVETFVLKTFKRFDASAESGEELLPMFKDEDDREFAVALFRQTILHGQEYRKRIDKHLKNWETERVAFMDMIIMQVAVAEIMTFPSIPVNVSFNEYIDAAKYYSTPKSGTFINGVLNSIVQELKSEHLLFKN